MLTIRLARPEDRQGIIEIRDKIENECGKVSMVLSQKNLDNSIAERKILVAVLGNRIIGILAYSIWDDNLCELSELFVIRRFRKLDVESKLMRRFLSLKPVSKSKQIWIHVDSPGRDKLYEQFGFKKVTITMLKRDRSKLSNIFDSIMQKISISSELKRKHKTIFALLIAFAVVSFWRGVWGLMDKYLFPNNYQLSIWASLIIGIAILIATNYATKELM